MRSTVRNFKTLRIETNNWKSNIIKTCSKTHSICKSSSCSKKKITIVNYLRKRRISKSR